MGLLVLGAARRRATGPVIGRSNWVWPSQQGREVAARVSPPAATTAAAGAGARDEEESSNPRRGARRGEKRRAEEPKVAMNGLKGDRRRRAGEYAGSATGRRGGAPAVLAKAAEAADRHETRALPWSDRPATPHAGARRRRAVREPKAAFFPGVGGGAAAARRRDRERGPELPRRGGCSLSTLVRARRAGGSRRTIGRPAATSSASATSAHLSTVAGAGGGEGEGGAAGGASEDGAAARRSSGCGDAGDRGAGGESPSGAREQLASIRQSPKIPGWRQVIYIP